MDTGQTTLNIALIHHPVLNKRGETIGSAVTNLDIHDIARMAKTYGVARYYIVTPYEDQQQLVEELLDHWRVGHGAQYNPARKQALEIVHQAACLEDALQDMTRRYQRNPLIVSTTATADKCTTSYVELRNEIMQETPTLLLFGTAHGLANEVFDRSTRVLPPIDGGTSYNHLSVRSAASIIVDRLLGIRDAEEQ